MNLKAAVLKRQHHGLSSTAAFKSMGWQAFEAACQAFEAAQCASCATGGELLLKGQYQVSSST
jgi:hypothetical protein